MTLNAHRCEFPASAEFVAGVLGGWNGPTIHTSRGLYLVRASASFAATAARALTIGCLVHQRTTVPNRQIVTAITAPRRGGMQHETEEEPMLTMTSPQTRYETIAIWVITMVMITVLITAEHFSLVL
jgi:hypothetical protein